MELIRAGITMKHMIELKRKKNKEVILFSLKKKYKKKILDINIERD